MIHSSAIVAEGADVDPTARIGPYCVVDDGAVIGPGCVIDSHARIYGNTRMGANNRVCHGATLGSEAQDLGFNPDKAKPLTIGDHNHFKEYVNISCGVKETHGTMIGSHNFMMAYSHIGHDCVVGDHNIFANGATLAGHVELAHHVFLSGFVAVHQFCRVGAYVMLGGITGVRTDVPPYVIANGHTARFAGINTVGLRRAGFDQTRRSAIKKAYQLVYRSALPLSAALEQLRADASADVRAIAEFFEHSKRGCISYRRETSRA